MLTYLILMFVGLGRLGSACLNLRMTSERPDLPHFFAHRALRHPKLLM